MVSEGVELSNLDVSFQNLVVAGREGKMERKGDVMTCWGDLPTELLLRIVSLADDRTFIVASGVCTAWRDALSAGLDRLSLSWCKDNMNDLLLSLAPRFTKLQTIILRQNRPQVEDDAIEAVANHCHDLREMDLSKSHKLSDRSLYALGYGCPSLTMLNISGCSGFSDSALAYMLSLCKNLKRLNLCGCGRAATDKALQAVAHNCSQIQSLNLGWCEGVTDKGVISLASGCPDLRALDLCGCVLITDDSVIALASGCPRLRSLDLYYCQNITDKAMYSLANRGGKAAAAAATGYGEAGLMNLNISQCTALTPPAVQAVCDSFPALHTCPGRHSLNISGCLSLTSVHCACAVQARRSGRRALAYHPY